MPSSYVVELREAKNFNKMRIKPSEKTTSNGDKNDEKSLSLLFGRYERELYSFILYKLGDRDLSNDLLQEVFLRITITLKQGRYNDEGKFIAWAKRIAHNLVVDHYRARSRGLDLSCGSVEESRNATDILGGLDANIEERMIDQQISEDLKRLVNSLPEIQQQVIKLRFFNGLSFKEIADHTNSSVNTTLGRVRYALINIRKLIDHHQIVLTKQ